MCNIYNQARFDCIQLQTYLKFLIMKMYIAGLCTLLFELVVISGVPLAYDDYRFPRSPQRAVMLSGYYGGPSEYNPEGAMTAFVTGDTLATNSFLGRKHNSATDPEEFDVPVEENVEHGLTPPALVQPNREISNGGVQPDAFPQNGGSPAKRNPKRKPVKPVEAEEDGDEDEGSWPFQQGRRVPSYNAFFPIMFGGYRGVKGRDSDGGFPGSATAIANSFSTGRGGVASSHATAYGDPYVNALLKGLQKKPSQKEE
ncbi:hypothetical protein PPYR_08041 [Photinus pyralis]|uniref:Uncharacterized protein n=1 Tax=Photinus pyralis TaxID=7054 RepID=A0A1Y1LJG0_PHOPY|nr:uncharacterized protein LOC116168587 [Photinus pyralis]KAB0800161.1 hypothetical protein PPYR_08041 [Photinus pyralis]